MLNRIGTGLCGCLTSALLVAPAYAGTAGVAPIAPSGMPRLGAVDQRFQSYNIEMIEVTGGRFWKPYRSEPGVRSLHNRRDPDRTRQRAWIRSYINTGRRLT